MKFSCLKDNLVRGINIAGHLALKNTNLPILNNILFKTDKNLLTITTTNLEAGIHHEVRGKTEEAGECLVPAKTIIELSTLLPEGTIEINNNKGLTIIGKNLNTTLRTAPITDFPIIPTIEKTPIKIQLPTNQLAEALDKTTFATGRIDSKPQFGGVFFRVSEPQNKKLIMAATDGYRLSEVTIILTKQTKEFSLIIPASTTQEIRRIIGLGEDEETTTIEATENQVNLTIGSTQIISRLIDGEFPDYQPLFPEKTLTECIVSKNEFTKAIKAASLFSRAGIYDVSLTAAPGQEVEIFSENTNLGSHRNQVKAEVRGEKNTITFNARYVLDGLAAISGETIKILMTGSERPLLLKPTQENNGFQFRHLIVLIKQG